MNHSSTTLNSLFPTIWKRSESSVVTFGQIAELDRAFTSIFLKTVESVAVLSVLSVWSPIVVAMWQCRYTVGTATTSSPEQTNGTEWIVNGRFDADAWHNEMADFDRF